MKKIMFLMAVAGMFAFAACNSKTAEPEVADTMPAPIEEVVNEAEDLVDSAAAMVESAAEEVVSEAADALK